MFRLLFTYVLPLVAPSLLYLVWNWVQMRRALAGKRTAPPPGLADMPWLVLAGSGISLLIVVLLGLALFGGAGVPGSEYIPPHLEDGRVVPGQTR